MPRVRGKIPLLPEWRGERDFIWQQSRLLRGTHVYTQCRESFVITSRSLMTKCAAPGDTDAHHRYFNDHPGPMLLLLAVRRRRRGSPAASRREAATRSRLSTKTTSHYKCGAPL